MLCGGSFRAKTLDENDVYKLVKVNNKEIKVMRGGKSSGVLTAKDITLVRSNATLDTGRRSFIMPGKNLDAFRKRFSLETSNMGLDAGTALNPLRPLNQDITAPRIDSYRFSMANLEDSPEVDLDAILGELCALETQYEQEIGNARDSKRLSDAQKLNQRQSRTHLRSSSEGPRLKIDSNEDNLLLKTDSVRTDSPDNDSAFSDTVSMLSSESSASSGGSATKPQSLQLGPIQDEITRAKAEKIRLAMEKIKEANIQKVFVKVFTMDGSTKSLLVDEKMSCAYITRLLADKNHVQMDPKWALVEHLPELYMERMYEDHEQLVENLLLWTADSKNKIYFAERPDKTMLFQQPEKYLLHTTDKRRNLENDEHSRNLLLEEFFSPNTHNIPEVEGPLYLKSESKKGWKKYYFVLRASGLYYVQKEKLKTTKDLVCLAKFDVNQVYYGIGWKKKYKAPTDFCFAIKHPKLQEPKSTKYIKYLCAEDQQSLERWMTAMRIAKFGKQVMDNYRCLMDELAQEDLDMLAHARSCSVSSIALQSNVTTPTQSYSASDGYGTQSETYSSAPSEVSLGRHSRASSSSSSGCMSDGAPSSCENAFDSEFPMGTIKRKPSMKPSLPLTSITRQIKEVGETREIDLNLPGSPVSYTNTGTLTKRHSRRKSNSDDSSNSGTLKRQQSYKARGSLESMGNRSGNSTPLCGTPVRERASPFCERSKSFSERSSYTGNTNVICSPTPSTDLPSMTDSITSLPPPPENSEDLLVETQTSTLPPPPPELYNSNVSLDSLPPPPNPSDLPSLAESDLTGSQLSLMSLPPLPSDAVDTGTIKRNRDSNTSTPTNVLSPDRTPTQGLSPEYSRKSFSPTSNNSSNCSTPTQTNPPISFSQSLYANGNAPPYVNPPAYRPPPPSAFNNSNGLRSSLRQSLPRQNSYDIYSESRTSSLGNQKNDITSPRKAKKISFNLIPQEAPALPKKPTPPKRSENTKLSSPKKLNDPPIDFLKDLQRVMRKKWQVAQKCKEEPTTTPHEVLGFRDPPIVLPDYKETNVSNWVQEHYGPNNFYENVYTDCEVSEYSCSPIHVKNEHRISGDMTKNRRPPPPPPKRSETTQLTSNKLH